MIYGKTEREAKRWLKKFSEWEIETYDWNFLKLCLLKVMTKEFSRKPFSKRNRYNQLWMNPFEVKLANYWFELTGKMPTIMPKLNIYDNELR